MKNGIVHLALFFVSLFYAILFSWAGDIMPKFIAPGGFVLMRVTMAFILFSGLLFLSKSNSNKINWKSDGLRIFICAFFGTAFNMLLFFYGLSKTHPINGAVLMMVTPLFVVVFDHIKQKKLPRPIVVVGFILGCVGAIMLISGKGVQFNSETLFGDILVAINALFYAIYLVLVRDLFKKYGTAKVNTINFGLGILLILPFGLTDLMAWNPSRIPNEMWLKIAYILTVTTFVVYQLNAFAVKRAGPEIAGLYIYLQPLLAALIAILWGKDELTTMKVISSLIIVAGVYLASRKVSEV